MDDSSALPAATLEGSTGVPARRPRAPRNRLEPRNVEVREWLFPERKRLAESGAGPGDGRYLTTSKNFRAPRFRALYRQWLEDPTNTLWMAGSNTLGDALDRDHGRVECVELSRQYLHLSPLVDVA